MRRVGRIVALIIIFFGTGAASAQTPQPGDSVGRTPRPSATSDDAAARGRRAMELGHDEEATALLEQAYQQSGDAALLFELGEIQLAQGHTERAKHLFETYLLRAPKGSRRPSVERRLREIELSAIAPAQVPAPAAELPAPEPTPAPAVTTGPAPSAPPPPAPTAPPTSAPTAPPAPVQAEPQRESLLVTSKPHDEASVAVALPVPRWLTWTGAVIATGLVGGAIATGLAAGHRYDELHRTCGATPEGCPSRDIDGVKAKARTANLLWGAAAVVGVATGVAVYLDAREGGISKLWTF